MVQGTRFRQIFTTTYMQNLLIWIKTEILIYLFQGTWQHRFSWKQSITWKTCQNILTMQSGRLAASPEKAKYAPLVRLIDINNDGELELIYRYRADQISTAYSSINPSKGTQSLTSPQLQEAMKIINKRRILHTPGEKNLSMIIKLIRTAPTSVDAYPSSSLQKFFDDYDNDGDIDYIAECPFGKKYYMHFSKISRIHLSYLSIHISRRILQSRK